MPPAFHQFTSNAVAVSTSQLTKAVLRNIFANLAQREPLDAFMSEHDREDETPPACDRSLEATFREVENELEAHLRDIEDDVPTLLRSETDLAAFAAGLPTFEAEFGSSDEESSESSEGTDADEELDASPSVSTSAGSGDEVTPRGNVQVGVDKLGFLDRVRERWESACVAVNENAERGVALVADRWEAADSVATGYLHVFDRKFEDFLDKSEAVRVASVNAMEEKAKAAKVAGNDRVQKTVEHFKGVTERARETYESLETTGKKYSDQLDNKLKDGVRAAKTKADRLQTGFEYVKCRTVASSERVQKGVDSVRAKAQAAVSGFPLRRPGQARPGGA